jgi:hypothetical protein
MVPTIEQPLANRAKLRMDKELPISAWPNADTWLDARTVPPMLKPLANLENDRIESADPLPKVSITET